jgi:lysophospholipase L1-like esterase
MKRSIANGVDLRIMPLGDSITDGYQSSDGNGYREDLLNRLSGNYVDFIGSSNAGDMDDNQNEGHSGAFIDEIAGYAQNSLPERPNIVLVMAGTNDINGNRDVDTAPDRLGNLLDEIIGACPDAAVIVAQLTPIDNADSQARADAFNAAIPGLVSDRADDGARILYVTMTNELTTADLSDGLHPNDHGYDLMSEVWYGGIEQAANNSWIQEPVDV